MNRAENQLVALGGGTLLIGVGVSTDETASKQTLTLDKTVREIITAMQSGVLPLVGLKKHNDTTGTTAYSLCQCKVFSFSDSEFEVVAYELNGDAYDFLANTLDAYPTVTLQYN